MPCTHTHTHDSAISCPTPDMIKPILAREKVDIPTGSRGLTWPYRGTRWVLSKWGSLACLFTLILHVFSFLHQLYTLEISKKAIHKFLSKSSTTKVCEVIVMCLVEALSDLHVQAPCRSHFDTPDSMRSLKLSNIETGWCLDGWWPWDRRKWIIIFSSLSFSLVRLLWRVLIGQCCARWSIQIWKRWQGHWNAKEISSSMLAPCDLVGRGDSLGPKILSQTRFGLTTLGGKIPSWSEKTSDALVQEHHLFLNECRTQTSIYTHKENKVIDR